MINDHELLRILGEQRREELRRSMERSRTFQPGRALEALRRPVRNVVVPLRPTRREA
jgi:hypothetical protein